MAAESWTASHFFFALSRTFSVNLAITWKRMNMIKQINAEARRVLKAINLYRSRPDECVERKVDIAVLL